MKNILIAMVMVAFLASNVSAQPTCAQRLKKMKQDHELGYRDVSGTLTRLLGQCQYDKIVPELIYLRVKWGFTEYKAEALKELQVRYRNSPFTAKLKKLLAKESEAEHAEKSRNQKKYGVYGEITRSDGRFIYFDAKNSFEGIVLDTKTGLMWGNGPAHKTGGYTNISWDKAKEYCDYYTLGGFTDWRMPTLKELKDILDVNGNFHKNIKYRGFGKKNWTVHSRSTNNDGNYRYRFFWVKNPPHYEVNRWDVSSKTYYIVPVRTAK